MTSDANNIYLPSKSSVTGLSTMSPPPLSALISEIEFGNFTTNSYVYVGGLPSWYSTKLSMLALPSVVFEPRFRGSIRNILYADDDTARPRRQEVMAYKVRLFVDLKSNLALLLNEGHNKKVFFPQNISNITYFPALRRTIFLQTCNMKFPP